MMRKMIALAALSLGLSGCAAIQAGATQAGNYLCANRDSLALSYLTLQQNAALIENPIVRQAMLGAAQAGLAALSTCPPVGFPAPPGS